jgi:hypothetical protein
LADGSTLGRVMQRFDELSAQRRGACLLGIFKLVENWPLHTIDSATSRRWAPAHIPPAIRWRL